MGRSAHSRVLAALVTMLALAAGSASRAAEPVSLSRYVREAPPFFALGNMQPLDQAVVEAFCRDADGCEVVLEMVNWDAAEPGNVASRSFRLFLSETSAWFRLSNLDTSGLDGNNVVDQYQAWDCALSDADYHSGAQNDFHDLGVGFSLVNFGAGDYNDVTTVCRLVLID